jgi:histidinol-phosphate aminotransferase
MIKVADSIKNLKPYVPGRSIEDIKEAYNLDVIHKLASNENPLGASPKAIEAMQKAFSSVHRYPDIGAIKLRSKIAEKFDVKIENVAVGNGSEGIMGVIMRAFLMERDEMITSEATFIGFQVLAQGRSNKCNYIQMPRDSYKFDLDGIANAINDYTKLIYLCNPNNPTGTAFTKNDFDEFIKKVPENVLVLLDEAYFEYACHNEDYPDSMHYKYDNVLTLRTFSKAYGIAGIRVGYAFGHEDLIETIMKVKLPFEPGNVAQEGAVAALGDDEFLEKTQQLNKDGYKFLTNEFSDLGLKWFPSYSNFILIELGSEDEVTRINEELLVQGIIIRPLKPFGLETCIRITIGIREENEFLIEALKKIV